MKNSKRAFTIVELVIVIAVIAILAAVLIPTFSGLIEKANVNSDQAAVKQMNTYLASDEQINGKCSGWEEAVKVLNKSNLDAQNYMALADGYQIVYAKDINRVLYVKGSEVIYPEEYKDVSKWLKNANEVAWVYLSGKYVPDDSWRSTTYTNLPKYETTTKDGETAYKSGDKVYKESELADLAYVDYTSPKDVNLAAMEFKNNSSIKSGSAEFVGSDGKTYKFSKLSNAAELIDYNGQINKMSKEEVLKTTKNETLIISKDMDLGNTEWTPINSFAGNVDGSHVNPETGIKENSKVENLNLNAGVAQIEVYEGSDDSKNFYYGFISVFRGEYLGNLTFAAHDVEKPGYDQISSNFGKTTQRGGQYAAVVCGLIRPVSGSDADHRTKVTIENITVEGGEVISAQRAAGMFGAIGEPTSKSYDSSMNPNGYYEVTFKNCVNKANVTSLADNDGKTSSGYATASGIVGKVTSYTNNSKVVFENCVNEGNVTGLYAAGFVSTTGGSGDNGEIKFINCENKGTITSSVGASLSERTFAGGFAAGFMVVCNRPVDKISFVDCKSSGQLVINQTGNVKSKEAYYYIGAFHADTKCDPSGEYSVKNITLDNCTFDKVKYIINVNYASRVRISDGNAYETVTKNYSNAKVQLGGLYFN